MAEEGRDVLCDTLSHSQCRCLQWAGSQGGIGNRPCTKLVVPSITDVRRGEDLRPRGLEFGRASMQKLLGSSPRGIGRIDWRGLPGLLAEYHKA
ncbi:hypothetical protein GE21DRAFT_6241 [Neurospora crassa]|uniref:Uncharacterized protein n=1 Tax=Neurospora crassa (strain ATCC 24698 / 74-OR23-1A / CBS 708.71 / DSM 1257 / FGSC 987) TaxID=367110 RepID=Q7SAM6_NEUCR|nr:hypothetical protein NCU08015 [Neurospora crassa OR74A]EAA33449.1 hypothetical protein NCU08015 [Neurospora crassa OR74A]KHE84418.1 hypothetical protein GE21DRAFT_6241 [Neurospora crassa]|eukprot:XP_962685.1 hypothetical protein NCU08015 [Neurospora crassa OR74A]